ncbi:MAG: AAA family ATPase [Pseudonocardia sp.]
MDDEEAYAAIGDFFTQQRIPFSLGSAQEFKSSLVSNLVLRRVVAKVLDIQEKTRQVTAPTRKVEEIVHDVFSGDKRLNLNRSRFEVVSGDRVIALESLSSGERQMLRMLVECLSAGGNSILIDEPELSMHVDWQNQLINSMRTVNPKCQIIAATHSPEVMAELDDDYIFEMVSE